MQLKSPDLVIVEKFRVFKIMSWKESVLHGDGAGWCVADTKQYYERYTNNGDLWYLHKKGGGKWRPWCSVYRRRDDNSFEIAKRGNDHLEAWKLCQEYPDLKKWLTQIGATTDKPLSDFDRTMNHWAGDATSLNALRNAWDQLQGHFNRRGDQTLLQMAQQIAQQVDDRRQDQDPDDIYRRAMSRMVDDVERERADARRRRDAQRSGAAFGQRQRNAMEANIDRHMRDQRDMVRENRRRVLMEEQFQRSVNSYRELRQIAHDLPQPDPDNPQWPPVAFPDVPLVGALDEIRPTSDLCLIGKLVRTPESAIVWGLKFATMDFEPHRAAYHLEMIWVDIDNPREERRVAYYMDAGDFHENRTPMADEIERRLML